MNRKKKYLHLHTRLDEYDQLALRQGFAALRELHGDATVAPIRNYADYTRAAIHRLAADVRAALAEQRSADAKQAA